MPNSTDPDITNTLTDLLSHLIQMPTVTGENATNRAALDWVEEQLRDLPLNIQRYERAGFPSLVATTTGTANPKNPKLWLVGHIDVVPGPTKTFTPRLADGRIYGRGVHDMKFAVACYIALLQGFGASLKQYDLGLMLTSDEEFGGFNGVKWLLNDQDYRGSAAIIPDSGGSWQMEIGSKGIMWWDLTASGQTAHASRPWEGTNAIDEIYHFVDQIKAHFPSEPCGDDTHNHPTVNLATISGGAATNQVPASAKASIDIRLTTDVSLAEAASWFEAATSAYPSITATAREAEPPYLVKNNGPVHAFRDIVREVTGHDVTTATSHGSSDARHFAVHNISTINVVPTGSGFHVPDEWVDIIDLARFYEILRRFTINWSSNHK